MLWTRVILAATLLQAPAADDGKYAHECRRALAGATQPPQDLKWFGPEADHLLRWEPEGLRITLPTGYPGERPFVGVTLPVVVQGDFEITLVLVLLGLGAGLWHVKS